MKKFLSIIFVSVLLSGNGYAESSWFEVINDDDNTSYHFNLKKVEEISPNKFKIQSVTIKTPKRLKYEEFLIKNLVPYCGKPEGYYREPAEFLTNGKPTTSERALQYIPGMEEILWNDYKAGKSKQPAGMSIEEFEFATYGNFISKGSRNYLPTIYNPKLNRDDLLDVNFESKQDKKIFKLGIQNLCLPKENRNNTLIYGQDYFNSIENYIKEKDIA